VWLKHLPSGTGQRLATPIRAYERTCGTANSSSLGDLVRSGRDAAECARARPMSGDYKPC
jgi:hypothetical protein